MEHQSVCLHAIEFYHTAFGGKVCSLGSQLPSALSLYHAYLLGLLYMCLLIGAIEELPSCIFCPSRGIIQSKNTDGATRGRMHTRMNELILDMYGYIYIY